MNKIGRQKIAIKKQKIETLNIYDIKLIFLLFKTAIKEKI